VEKEPITNANYLCAIRQDVNEQKHALIGFRRSNAHKSTDGPWFKLRFATQYEYVLKAFKITCASYIDLHEAYFVKRKLIPLSKKEEKQLFPLGEE